MHISRLVVRNFRNFALLDVPIQPGVTCIVGENNTGKTNLLHAIRLAVDAGLSSQYRVLTADDFPAGTDFSKPQQVVVSLELQGYAAKPHEEATAGPWAIADDLARITYRFRPGRPAREDIQAGARLASSLTMDDYKWEIRGADGEVDPTKVEWDQDSGRSVRFEELQQFLVTLMHPLRDVEQALRQSAGSPLGRLLSASDISEAEQQALVGILADANNGIAASKTIAHIGKAIEKTFADTAGEAFKMGVSLGMASPSFTDISRSLTVLLSNRAMTGFAPRLNGLGLNNVLFITMLLNFFEGRSASNKTPGQLLLVEEPEAHLHPQLQRVLFGALLKRGCQIISTTHSTHITSHVPLNSIVVLTDDGTPCTSSCAPSKDSALSATNTADLERYLDATRGALLFARKVILVEGPAELFLIPAIVRQVMNIDLDELGVSVVPIYGVHFDAYARLFGKTAISKKCAIIADGDMLPSDGAQDDDDEDGAFTKPDLNALENDFVKVFACKTTFEREMTAAQTLDMFAAAAAELGKPRAAARMTALAVALKAAKNGKSLEEARALVLSTAIRCGKARFAQVASKHVALATGIPTYIANAIKWLYDDPK